MSPASLLSSLFSNPATQNSSTVEPISNSPLSSEPSPLRAAQVTFAPGNGSREDAEGSRDAKRTERMDLDDDTSGERARPPYLHAMIAGGIGGSTGDALMHSLDTVKTRQQGAPNVLKYSSMGDAYSTIFREEGFRRGLYGGVTPAIMGSLPATMIFFGTYEWTKRTLLDNGCPENIAYLTGGFIGDLCSSVIYVPSEVLKTRLQLQGRYNNPFFHSGYNYRGTWDAARTIARVEGPGALFYGYKATLVRDLPFSALQFAFYERFQQLAKWYKKSSDIGIPLEILTGGAAGGLAGAMTCPLDVVKTRVQTQVRAPLKIIKKSSSSSTTGAGSEASKAAAAGGQKRAISTSSPSTTTPDANAAKLNTSSIIRGLGMIYKQEGIPGLFRGVGPRFVWTSVQSGTMLVLYQSILRQLNKHFGDGEDYGEIRVH